MRAGEKKARPPARFLAPAPLSRARLPVLGLSRTKYPPRAIRPNPKIISWAPHPHARRRRPSPPPSPSSSPTRSNRASPPPPSCAPSRRCHRRP
jgi:hypothetical protein